MSRGLEESRAAHNAAHPSNRDAETARAAITEAQVDAVLRVYRESENDGRALIRDMLVAAQLAASSDQQVESLLRWKSEALEVLADWELVFDALGRPGRLGESKAAASLDALRALLDGEASRTPSQTEQFQAARDHAHNLTTPVRMGSPNDPTGYWLCVDDGWRSDSLATEPSSDTGTPFQPDRELIDGPNKKADQAAYDREFPSAARGGEASDATKE